MINLKQIENDTRRIYEDCFELSLLEEQLEDMLTALDKNNIEFERGKISRTAFKANESKLKKDSVRIIKIIKDLIKSFIASFLDIHLEGFKEIFKRF